MVSVYHGCLALQYSHYLLAYLHMLEAHQVRKGGINTLQPCIAEYQGQEVVV